MEGCLFCAAMKRLPFSVSKRIFWQDCNLKVTLVSPNIRWQTPDRLSLFDSFVIWNFCKSEPQNSVFKKESKRHMRKQQFLAEISNHQTFQPSKESDMRFLAFCFFHRSVSPHGPKYPIEAITNFYENSRIYSNVRLITGINDNGDKWVQILRQKVSPYFV